MHCSLSNSVFIIIYYPPGPQLSINFSGSQFTSYDVENGQYVFNVEQGTPFHVNFLSNTRPPPWVELYRDDQHLPRVQGGTILIDGDSMDIQRVDGRYEGTYTIKTSSGRELVSFQLRVQGNQFIVHNY